MFTVVDANFTRNYLRFVWSGLRSSNDYDIIDDKLFNRITSDEQHVLHQLLPPDRPDCLYTHSDHEDTNSVSHPDLD